MKHAIIKVIILYFIIILCVIYFNRYQILNYTINKTIESLIPDYLKIGELKVDFHNKEITIKDLTILNPPGYNNSNIVWIPTLKCRYDHWPLFGKLEVKEPLVYEPLVYLERSKDNTTNLYHMNEVLKRPCRPKRLTLKSAFFAVIAYALSPIKAVDLSQLKPMLIIRNGRILFNDRFITARGYTTIVDGIDAKIFFEFEPNDMKLVYIKSEGSGFLNRFKEQPLSWASEYNLKRRLISNTLILNNIDFVHFKPYYDRFFPFVFNKGRASGNIIFNLDKQDINSTSELKLNSLDFSIKKEAADKRFLGVSIDDLCNYFMSNPDDVVVDFKIKGSIEKPKFYLGPKIKKALAIMVITKLADTILGENPEGPQQTKDGSSAGKGGYVKKIINIFKNIEKSKNP